MNGFGNPQRYNINEIITSIERQIKDIKSDFNRDVIVLQNKLNNCVNDLATLRTKVNEIQNYTETEYQKLQSKIEGFDEQIADIRSRLNTISYRSDSEIVGPGEAYGINNKDIWANHAVQDNLGRQITATYATKAELNASGTYLDNKIDSISAESISGLSSVSSILKNEIYTEISRASNKETEILNTIDTVSSTLSSTFDDKIIEVSGSSLSSLSSVSSTLNQSIETEVQRAQTKENELDTKIEEEKTRAMSAENVLSGKLSEEINRATNKETQLQQNIDTLSGAVDYKESALNTKIEAETSRAIAKETDLETAISNEVTARETAVNNLETAIASETVSRETEINRIVEAINDEKTRAIDAEEALDSKIDSSVETINGTISDLNTSLSNALDQEITNRTSAESALQTNIDNEATARSEADIALQTNIDNEVTARENKDTELSGAISDEVTARTSADETLQSNIDAEANDRISAITAEQQARTTAINSLSSEIDENYYTKDEVDEAIANFGGFEVHSTTADIPSPKTNVIYLIGPDTSVTGDDKYAEYIYDNGFVLIGETSVDLTNYYNKDEINTFTANLNDAITAETTRATGAENTISQNLVASATNLENTITSLSGTVNETIESLSGEINTQYTEVNNSITDLDSRKQDNLTQTQLSAISSVPGLSQETDYLKVSLERDEETIYGGMIGNHNINSENAGKVLRINTEGTDLELIRITGGLSYHEIDSSDWPDDVRVNVDLDSFNDCGTIPSNVKNIYFLFDKPIDPQSMPNGIIHFELPSDATLLAVNVYYKVNDDEYIECNYSYLNRKDYKYPIYFNPKHIYQITLNNHNAAFFDFSDNVYEKKNYIQPWYLDTNSTILHHFPTDDPEVFNITSGSPYDDVGFSNKIELITSTEKFGYHVRTESAGFSNFIEKIDIKSIYQTTNAVASAMSASAGFGNKIEQINRLDKYQYNVSSESYSVSNELNNLNKQTLFRYLSEPISDTDNSVSNELVDLKITQVIIEGYTREG